MEPYIGGREFGQDKILLEGGGNESSFDDLSDDQPRDDLEIDD